MKNDKLSQLFAKALLDGTLIKRYDHVWPQYARSDTMTYHNVAHAMAVTVLALALEKHNDVRLPKDYRQALELAAAYHDVGHSGKPDSVVAEDTFDNISRAMYVLTVREVRRGAVSRAVVDMAARLITATRWPKPETDSFWDNNNDTHLKLAADLLCDADMLHGLMPGMRYQSMVGLIDERLKYVPEEQPVLTSEEIYIRHRTFLTNYVPRTGIGRSFKNRYFDHAAEEWTAILVRRMREEVLAEELAAHAIHSIVPVVTVEPERDLEALRCDKQQYRAPSAEDAQQMLGVSEVQSTNLQ